MKDVEAAVKSILDSAKKVYKIKGRHVSYQDYEFFKSQLLSIGVFGKERELAQALHL